MQFVYRLKRRRLNISWAKTAELLSQQRLGRLRELTKRMARILLRRTSDSSDLVPPPSMHAGPAETLHLRCSQARKQSLAEPTVAWRYSGTGCARRLCNFGSAPLWLAPCRIESSGSQTLIMYQTADRWPFLPSIVKFASRSLLLLSSIIPISTHCFASLNFLFCYKAFHSLPRPSDQPPRRNSIVRFRTAATFF